jgi:hypothetical protein
MFLVSNLLGTQLLSNAVGQRGVYCYFLVQGFSCTRPVSHVPTPRD